MKLINTITAALSVSLLTAGCRAGGSHAETSPDLVVIATTDVHGNFYPYDFITGHEGDGSLARVSSYVDSLREALGPERVILLDNGDILQGQPPAYYYNFIDTASPHLAADIYHFMDYDAATVGNHDIETGHDVYDRWRAQCGEATPVLAANVTDTATGLPYFRPYTVIERGGARIAVLGLLTPAIPAWLPENLRSGMRFDDMTESATRWMEIIRRDERPDVVVGLFHSGADSTRNPAGYIENAALQVARRVPGFDLIIFGHDHRRHNSVQPVTDGTEVTALNPANNALAVARADIRLNGDARPDVTGTIVDITGYEPSERFTSRFAPQRDAVLRFVSDTVGHSNGTFDGRDAFFGPSAFIDLIHDLQLRISGADISMAAPLSLNAVIKKGPLTIADMFTLYKYENLLYVMELTGREIKGYLERSYAGWTDTMNDSGDHLLLFDQEAADDGRPGLATPFYNYDSAAGIDYTVDVTAPAGQRVTITGMSDGRPFDPDRRYRVAVNSYRGNGGGDLLTLGAGIAPDSLAGRVVSATDRDMRYYLMKAIRREGEITPRIIGNWKFVPEKLAADGAARDREILFGRD